MQCEDGKPNVRIDGAGLESGLSDVDLGSADDVDGEAEAFAGIAPAQKERIRELMGKRAKRKGAPRKLKQGTDDKESAKDPCSKKPTKGSE